MLLEKINTPRDLKKIDDKQIPDLAAEIRSFLVENVQKSGGHLASNLGVVELTLALHKVFDCPKDKIIFDVGHQSYVHKLITGRRDGFDALRKPNGISGFTKRAESEYDAFGAGHSSTAISASLGFAQAAKLNGSDSFCVAVVGDGAFTGGMVYEALNNCQKDLRLAIILNDNEMSISKNVGRMSKYIGDIRLSKKYINFKRFVSKTLNALPIVGEKAVGAVANVKDTIKKLLVFDSSFFESMGLRYFGPVDGHDYEKTKRVLEEAKRYNGCSIIHVMTKKGKGYEPAQENPTKYHSVSPTGSVCDNRPTFSQEFGKALTRLAKHNKNVCAVTAAMCEGTGLCAFEEKFGDRFFDVGIAEAHAVTFCAGLSMAGKLPVFAVYSSFLQRAYDNLLHDVALQNLPVILGIDRAGLSPDDGETHHGIYDVAMLASTGKALVLSPISVKSMEPMLTYGASQNKLVGIRYPKGKEDKELVEAFYKSKEQFKKIGVKCAFENDGSLKHCKYVFVSYGRVAKEAYEAAKILNGKEEASAGVILLEIICPFEKTAEKIYSLVDKNAKIVFVEEGIKVGGAGEGIQSLMLEKYSIPVKVCAITDIPDRSNSAEDFYKDCGLDRNTLAAIVKEI